MPLVQPQGWEPIWTNLDVFPEYWRTPETSVLAWAASLQKAGGRQALDLGCGIGRHTVALAHLGFAVTATDISLSGVKTCAAWLAREGLSATLACHEMGTLPFPNCAFDGLVAYNVVYHATLAGMRRILAEVRRVLRPGGRFYTTIIAREDSKVAICRADVQAGKCHETEPFTFVYPCFDDAPDDKYLPHHYCDEAELLILFADFAVDALRLDRREYVDDGGELQVGVHYHVQARRC
jgi:SAM-dependent methyltransferase